MAIDLALNRGPGADPEPGLEYRRQVPALGRSNVDHQLVALVRAYAADGRSLTSRSVGQDAKAVRFPAESDETAIAERPEFHKLLVLAGLAVQVADQPWLALGHERSGESLGVASGAGRSSRDGDDCHVPGIDRQTQVAGARRAPDRELDGVAGEPQRGTPLGRRRHCGKGTAADRPRAGLGPRVADAGRRVCDEGPRPTNTQAGPARAAGRVCG